MAKTSQTHPLRIGWLPRLAWCSEQARVGITFLPGKVGLAMNGELWARDLSEDLAVVAKHASVLVVLATQQELAEAGVGTLIDASARFDMALVHVGVAKGACLDGAHRPAALAALEQLRQGAARGRGVVVVSPSGLDRAAAFAVSAMVASGMPPVEAIEAVRTVRGTHALKSALQAADAVALGHECASTEAQNESRRLRECLLLAPSSVVAAFQVLADLHARQPDGRRGLPVNMPTYGRLSTATEHVVAHLAAFREALQRQVAQPKHTSEEEEPAALARLGAIYHLSSVVQLLQVTFRLVNLGVWTSPNDEPPEWQKVREQLSKVSQAGDIQGNPPPGVPKSDWRPRANLSRGEANWLGQGIGPLSGWSLRQTLDAVGAKLEALATIGAYIADLSLRLRGFDTDQEEAPIATAEDFGVALSCYATRRAGQVRQVLRELS